MRIALCLSICILIIFATSSFEQTIPHKINYQGWLTDNTADRNPVNGPVSILFKIYDADTAGNILWKEQWQVVNVSNGIFNVILGSMGTPIPASVFENGSERYLEVQINNQILSPRQKINSVAYSYKSSSTISSSQLGGISADNWQRALNPATCSSNSFLYGMTQSGTPLCSVPSNLYYAGSGLFMTNGNTFNVTYGTGPGTALAGNDPAISDWLISGSDVYAGVSGNVGIRTTSPLAKLDIAGNLRINNGSQGSGKILASDDNGEASWQAFNLSSFPAGAVMFFNLQNCPPGWSEFAAAQGRYMVALPETGSPNGTVGTALTNLENRPVGMHTHTKTDPGHSHQHECYYFVPGSGYGATVSQETFSAGPIWGVPTGITILDAGSVSGTNAPYIQLLICQKD